MMIEYVTGFMFSVCERYVVLVSKLGPAWQCGQLNGVGGKLEPGETSSEGMAREFLEETGIETHGLEWKYFSSLVRPGAYKVDFFFMKSVLAFAATTAEKEMISVYPTGQLPDNVIPNLRWLIPLALDPNLRFDRPVTIVESADADRAGRSRDASADQSAVG
jgi:8-oxo-dGTP diphosphatase